MEKEYRISWLKVMAVIVLIVIIIALFCLVTPKKSAGATSSMLSTYINNMNLMKEAGFEYFQGNNLPDKIGESETITLGELVDSKLIMDFVDENGKSCSASSSYIKATKTLDNEYAMKVNLSCDNKTDYIVTTIASKNIIADNNINNNQGNASNNNVNNKPVINNNSYKPSGGSTSNKGNTSNPVTQITNVNINYINTCGNNCNTSNCQNNCLNNVYYTVNFDTQGGDYVPRQVVKNGDTANYVITKKDGYLFLGWYLENVEYNFATPVTKTITLVAKWEKIKDNNSNDDNNQKPSVKKEYNVIFDTNGGSYVKNQTVIDGDMAFKPTNPTRDCYDFVGWYSDANFNYRFDFNTPITKDITLYAKWVSNGSCNKYIVSFNTNGAGNINSQEVKNNGYASRPTDPAKSCYDFAGWYSDANFNYRYDFNTPVTKDITLYAKWMNNGSCVNKYTVSYNSNGGTYVSSDTVREGDTVNKPTNPVRNGYIFKGWYYNGYEFNFNTKITHDYVLIAKWEKEVVGYNKYCKIGNERYYSVSYVGGDKKTTSYNWTIKFDNLANAKNVKIVNHGYIRDYAMYNDLYYKNNTNKGISMVGDNGTGHASYYSAANLQTYSLKSYNFNKYLSAAYYNNGNWYTNVAVNIYNYNNANVFYASNLNSYIYFVPFYFDVEYTDMNNCVWDRETNASKYSNYVVVDRMYE